MNKVISIFLLLFMLFSVSSHARKLAVGPSRTIKTIVDVSTIVASGDTVEIDSGLYIDQACIWSVSNTVIRGTTRYAHLKAPAIITNQKAILVVTGDNTIIENIEFSDAHVPDKNGAGIRQEGNNVTIRNCYFHDCEDGILGGKGYVVIEHSEFGFCGYGDGYSHNMYISACDSFLLRFCYTHNTSEGHTIKSRALKNYILYNRIESANSTTSYEINLPNGGTSFIIGNQIQQGAFTHNSAIIDFGSEGVAGHDTALYVINNTIVNDRSSGTFIYVRGTQARPKVVNNIFTGNGTICNLPMDSAGNFTGDPGFIEKSTYTYRLTPSSPAINRGVDPGSADFFDLLPVFMYVHHSSCENRTTAGDAIDAGAYEYMSVDAVHIPVTRGISSSRKAHTSPIFPGHRYDLMGRRIAYRSQGKAMTQADIREFSRVNITRTGRR